MSTTQTAASPLPVEATTPRSPRTRRWLHEPIDATRAAALAHEAGLPLLVAELLLARGLSTPEAIRHFLAPSLDDLLDPYSMLGMREAVLRIEEAIAAGQTMLLYGDYDVDGTTAIVLLKTALERLGASVRYHVPHRLREGYGMQGSILADAAADGIKLVISVDTGIRAFAEAKVAAELGLDLIVTDHHLPEDGTEIPEALAVLNPNQPGCPYACKALCGAGVAFKLAQALLEKQDRDTARKRILPSFLKMLAIATIADSVPLTGENRAIVALGLAGLRHPVNPGLRALLSVAKLDPAQKPISSTDVGFRLAPRINAAGRMDVAAEVVEMFTTRDAARAEALAQKLDGLNQERRSTEAAILEAIEERLHDPQFADALCLVVEGEGWHRGVLGILASRVLEKTGKPTIIVSCEEGQAHGSGRSIDGYHLLEAIESCSELFTRFGGHAHAVGFSMPAERVEALRTHLATHAAARLCEDDLGGPLTYHAELPLDEVTPTLYRWLRQLEPYGMSNEEPIFVARHVLLAEPVRVLKERHVKLQLTQSPRGARLAALGWHWAERVAALRIAPGDSLDIAYRLRENDHPDFGGLELEIIDLKPAH